MATENYIFHWASESSLGMKHAVQTSSQQNGFASNIFLYTNLYNPVRKMLAPMSLLLHKPKCLKAMVVQNPICCYIRANKMCQTSSRHKLWLRSKECSGLGTLSLRKTKWNKSALQFNRKQLTRVRNPR